MQEPVEILGKFSTENNLYSCFLFSVTKALYNCGSSKYFQANLEREV